MHDISLITTIAGGFTAAWLLGLLTQRLGMSPIVGYLLAGVVIGPNTPGFSGDLHIAQQLAEVGVILLMFGVGLHFHLKDLLAVRNVAVPGAVGQSLVATLMAIAVFSLFGLPPTTGAVIGMAMAVASTVVLMRVLMDADALNSAPGHVAVGWLIVEDIFTVILLVLIPVLGANAGAGSGEAAQAGPAVTAAGPLWLTLGLALLKLAALVAVVLVVGSRVVPWILVRVAKLRSRELFTLTVLVFSIAIAAAAYVFFGASMALGAFLAGMVVAQSPVSHQAAAEALPMRDAFAVLFFVAVGMLFDPKILIEQPLMILAALGIILIAKPVAALLIVALLGHSVRTALTVALGLAQIGEFSFILSDLARQHGIMPQEGHSLLVAAAIISITLNPMLFRTLHPLESWLRRQPRLWRLLNGRAERRAAQTNLVVAEQVSRGTSAGRVAIVIGFGPVGRSVHRLLADAGLTTVVVEMNLDTVTELNARGQTAVYGDASHAGILEQAGGRRASHFVLTLPHSADRGAIITAARSMNPQARVLVRARYLRERNELERTGATAAVFEEAEAALGLARLVLADTGVNREAADRKMRELRLALLLDHMSSARRQRVRSVMVPWTRVRRLLASASRPEVLRQIAQQRFTRWPVVDPQSGKCVGYVLTSDMIAQATAEEDWTRLIRPLRSVPSTSDVESTLRRMQTEGTTMYVVEDGGRQVGMITIEDILERVVGRIDGEHPHDPPVALAQALAAGGIALELSGRTREQVIGELAGLIPPERLPPGADVAALALEREAEISTDLGNGVAIPHARCPNLAAPLVVFGRSTEGVLFSLQTAELVRLVFLLVTPTEQPEVQLSLLGELAAVAGDEALRERLAHASSPAEVLDAIAESRLRALRAAENDREVAAAVDVP